MDNPIFKLEGVVHERSAETLQDFEGPLDLILFLLSKNKIEIQDIPIALILEQYLAYLEQRKQLDLEVAAVVAPRRAATAKHLAWCADGRHRGLLHVGPVLDPQRMVRPPVLLASLGLRLGQHETAARIKRQPVLETGAVFGMVGKGQAGDLDHGVDIRRAHGPPDQPGQFSFSGSGGGAGRAETGTPSSFSFFTSAGVASP